MVQGFVLDPAPDRTSHYECGTTAAERSSVRCSSPVLATKMRILAKKLAPCLFLRDQITYNAFTMHPAGHPCRPLMVVADPLAGSRPF